MDTTTLNWGQHIKLTSRDVKDAYYSVMINTNTEEHSKYNLFCTEKTFLEICCPPSVFWH